MLADELDYVVGVDTHRDEHALVAVAAPAGAVVASSPPCCSGRESSLFVGETPSTPQLLLDCFWRAPDRAETEALIDP